MLERIIGILKLDVNTYEEIEHDKGATTQAAIIVAIVALLTAISAAMQASAASSTLESFGGMEGLEGLSGLAAASASPVAAFINTLLSAFVGWVVWAATTTFIGTRFFGGKADMGEMLRVLGFARIPAVLGVIPCIGWLVGGIWSLVCGFIAVRQGLDLDNTKAAITIVLSFIVVVIVSAVIGGVVGLAGL